jgi:hypothetical protein
MHGNLPSPKKRRAQRRSASLKVDDRSPQTERRSERLRRMRAIIRACHERPSEYARRIGAPFGKSTVSEIIRVCHEISIASGRPFNEVHHEVFHGHALQSREYQEATALAAAALAAQALWSPRILEFLSAEAKEAVSPSGGPGPRYVAGHALHMFQTILEFSVEKRPDLQVILDAIIELSVALNELDDGHTAPILEQQKRHGGRPCVSVWKRQLQSVAGKACDVLIDLGTPQKEATRQLVELINNFFPAINATTTAVSYWRRNYQADPMRIRPWPGERRDIPYFLEKIRAKDISEARKKVIAQFAAELRFMKRTTFGVPT